MNARFRPKTSGSRSWARKGITPRALLRAEQDRGQEFLRLAKALLALYPKDNEEKRSLDAMLLAVPR